MSIPRFSKEFDTYEDAHVWLTERGISGALQARLPDFGIIEEMFPGGVLLTLEGKDAQRAHDLERPIDPAGFRLTEIERYA